MGGKIEFKNIHFGYVPEKIVLKNFSLSVKPGQKIAIVGATGSGKTTIINLLMRFYEPQSGSITIDGVDIRDIPKEQLRDHISIVLQDTVLWNDTIENNILYGNAEATHEEVIKAADTAMADRFTQRLPDGYNTIAQTFHNTRCRRYHSSQRRCDSGGRSPRNAYKAGRRILRALQQAKRRHSNLIQKNKYVCIQKTPENIGRFLVIKISFLIIFRRKCIRFHPRAREPQSLCRWSYI